MKTPTTYTQLLIITTDDDGNRTATRTHHAGTYTEYLFSELSPKAQERAIQDAIEEEQKDYWQGFGMTQNNVEEVWDAYSGLQKHQPVKWHDHYTSFFLTIEDAERVTPEEDTGICWSMDMCDAWNRYAAAVPLLIEEAEEHEATAEELSAPYYWYAPSLTSYDEPESASIWYKAHSDHADRCRAKAEELAEAAKDALESTIKSTIDDLETYYQSPDFWREWLDDGETRFTREGERI